jgi:hypothetical protein
MKTWEKVQNSAKRYRHTRTDCPERNPRHQIVVKLISWATCEACLRYEAGFGIDARQISHETMIKLGYEP